jgi:hypothetical protein
MPTDKPSSRRRPATRRARKEPSPDAARTMEEQEPQAERTRAHIQSKLPVQSVVDRRIALDIYLVPLNVTDDTGKILQILENPVGGPYGPLPSDPAWFPESVNPRLTACQLLSGYARARCLRAGGYF